LAACSSDDRAPPIAAGHPLPECPNANYATCDVREAGCQQQLLELAACVYGASTTPDVPVRVVTEQQLSDELSAQGGQSSGEDESAALPHIERTFVDLQLLQPGDLTQDGGSTAQLVENIDGVYQDAERGIALVDRGVAKNTVEADAVLVHEFVHGIQDARFGLDDWRMKYPGTIDTVLALRTVSEGQATYVQFRALMAMSGRDVGDIDWQRTFTNFRQQLLTSALDDRSPYLASITTFPYAYGVGLADEAWLDHEAQFAAPPQTTQQVMNHHPGDAFTAPEDIGMEAPTPDADYRLIDGSVLGAFQLQLIAHKLGDSEATAFDLALGWRADSLWIYAGPDDQTVWLWMVEMSDAQHADALISAAQYNQDLGATSSHTHVVLAGGSGGQPDFVLHAAYAFLNAPPP
jgi:hypothetical protein